MFSETQRRGPVRGALEVAAPPGPGAEPRGGLQLLAEPVQGARAGLQALGQFLNLGPQHRLAHPGGALGPRGGEEAARAEAHDGADGAAQGHGGEAAAPQQPAVAAALPAAEEVEEAQDLAHLVLAGGRDLLHPLRLPGAADDQGEVRGDGDGPAGRGHPQPHGRRHERGAQGNAKGGLY